MKNKIELQQEFIRYERAQLEDKLHERRGEWPTCIGCPLHLICYMKRYTAHIWWCRGCNAWTVEELSFVVRCVGFKLKSYNGEWASVRGICPNCDPDDARCGTYRIIEPDFDEET